MRCSRGHVPESEYSPRNTRRKSLQSTASTPMTMDVRNRYAGKSKSKNNLSFSSVQVNIVPSGADKGARSITGVSGWCSCCPDRICPLYPLLLPFHAATVTTTGRRGSMDAPKGTEEEWWRALGYAGRRDRQGSVVKAGSRVLEPHWCTIQTPSRARFSSPGCKYSYIHLKTTTDR